ncbi:DegT/DnrJ/EryC1/StrS family aminotransferase [Micromonospora sp. NPDC049559]|uniref:DegT/DnrJ/EryC1/StrS family aminotransferase n=1 Tax=Micromonospora sp. NPDC049559 TaxID=3155923 RepID=UPI0034222E6B
MIPLFKVAMSESAAGAVADVLASGSVGQGPLVKRFEQALAERLGNHRVVTVNSATAGLHLALRLVTDEPGQAPGEVLSTPLTFEATNFAVLANRLPIRWVDVDPQTLNVDLDDLARKITPATRAIMIVHFAGFPVDLARLSRILDDAEAAYGVRPVVIEDCAHAWGATYQGVPLGNHGNISVFSFQAIKHLTCVDGGLLVLPEDGWHRRARLLRWFGIDREADRLRKAPEVDEWGYKFHMNDVNAAIGLANLARVDEIVARHRANAAFYDRALAGAPGLEIIRRSEHHSPSYWVYPLRVQNRNAFVKRMDEAGIAVSQVHERNDRHPCVRQYRALLPGMDRVAEELICIPVGWWLSERDRQHVADVIRAGW